MKYSLRKLSTGKYSIINLSTSMVINTFKSDTLLKFSKTRSKEYVTLYHYKNTSPVTLAVLDVSNIEKIEKVENNQVIEKTLSPSFNKILTISNFFKDIYTLSSVDEDSIQEDLMISGVNEAYPQDTPIKTRRTRSITPENVHIPSVIKIDNNSISGDDIDVLNDTVMVNIGGIVKSITFMDLLKILTTINNKGKTIWDLGETADLDESDSGTNPKWS